MATTSFLSFLIDHSIGMYAIDHARILSKSRLIFRLLLQIGGVFPDAAAPDL
jgi:hypothetical protein